MEILQAILDNSQYAFVTAFVLGLMTAISPCPLATNISAIGFISRDIENQSAFLQRVDLYARACHKLYRIGGDTLFRRKQDAGFHAFQGWGEKILGPLLILTGLLMLDVIKLNFPGLSGLTDKIGERSKGSYWSALLLGMVFALAFCPYSGVLYFAMLIPLTISSASGLYLPVVFAIATGLPVILFAWLLAFAVGNVGKMYNRIKVFELWFRRVVSIVFIGIGIYYIVILWV